MPTARTNADLAGQLSELAQLLAAKGENPFKVKAYRRAAETIAGLGESIAGEVLADEDLTRHPGIGAGIAKVLRSLVHEDEPALLTSLRKSAPPELAFLRDYPGLDVKRVRSAFQKLGVSTIPELEARIADETAQRKLGIRTVDYFRRALHPDARILLFDADPVAAAIAEHLEKRCHVQRHEITGDYRRRVEVIGEFRVVAVTDDFPRLVRDLARFGGGIPIVEETASHARFTLPMGLPLHLRQVDLCHWGFATLIETGSTAHLEILERDCGLSRAIGRLPSARDEREAYRALGLAWIPPELREGSSEVDLAQRDALPVLVRLSDLRGDLHVHTTASDGWQSIEIMAERALEKGYRYIGITDHSQSLRIARGVSEAALWAQIREIDRLNEKDFGLRILKSAEVDILEGGRLDYPDDLLAELDYTVCSIHSLFRRPKAEQTERILRAMDNPHFGFLGHATGRLLLRRAGYEFDLEKVIAHASALGRGFEINASPDRLDLSAESARLVAAAGIRIAVNTDAHHTEDFEYMRCGIDVARRAGLSRGQVLNCLPLKSLLQTFAR